MIDPWSHIRTATPGEIVGAQEEDGWLYVDVQPLIQLVDLATREPVTLPVVPSVPVLFPRTNRARITFPVAIRHRCLLVVSDRMLDGFLEDGRLSPPTELRHHDLTDSVALVGLWEIGAGLPYEAGKLVVEL